MPEKKKATAKKAVTKQVKTIPAQEEQPKNPHTKMEAVLHCMRASSAKLLLSVTLVISLILVIGISWHALTTSYFYDHIPANTQAFLHVQLSPKTIVLLEKSAPIIQLPLPVASFQQAFSQIGIKYLTFVRNDQQNTVFFMEHISKNQALRFLSTITTNSENIETKKENGVVRMTVREGNELFCMYKSSTIFCSKQEKALQAFLPENFSPLPQLSQSLQKLPRLNDAYWFANTQIFSSPVLKAHKQSVSALFGALVVVSPEKIQSFIYAKTDQQFTAKEHLTRSSQDFSSLFPKDNSFFFLSGKNFFAQWENTEAFYTKNIPEYSLILKGMLVKKVQDLFGRGVDFHKDILPIFHGQFAIAATKDSTKTVQWNFVAEGNNASAIEKLVQAFYAERGQFTVEKKELQVDEKTLLQSVYSNEEKVKAVDERVGGAKVFGYTIQGMPWGLYLAQTSDKTYISTSLESLKNLLGKKDESLQDQFPHLLKNAYEFGFLSLQSLQGLFAFSPFGVPPLQQLSFIKDIAWESQSYPGGMTVVSTITLAKEGK